MVRAFALTRGSSAPRDFGVDSVRTSDPATPVTTIRSRLYGALIFLLLLLAMLVTASPAAAYEALQNGRLRFGTGAEASVNARGNLQQPFYYDSVLGGGGWYKLTFSSYPLNNAIGVGGDGTSNWNLNGSITQDPTLVGQVVDVSNFVRTSGDNGYGTIVSTGNVTIGGQTFQVRNTYSLGQTDSFIRIVTRITNTGAAPLQNLRVWVGTQDDWVGNSDSPTKRRGNLINGVFTNISTASAASSALQVSSGTTGVLFFSNSSRAYTSVNNCCSFSNSYQQNPATSAITLTNDGSYALFVRMNDLAVGQSDEFTWYYAAGELSNLGQIVAAVAAASVMTLPVNGPVTPFIPVTSTGGTGTLTYSISPALPPGLVFNSTNGQISGTPTVTSPPTVYTVTITDSIPSSTSATFTLSVTASNAATQLTLSSSPNPAPYGAPVTLTVIARGTNPTGTVDFRVFTLTGIMPVCTGVTLASGMATCSVPGEYQKASQQLYQVVYGGDTNNPAASTVISQLVASSKATLTAMASPQVPVAGRSLTLNALAIQPGMNGAVTFNENGATLPGCGAIALAPVGGSADTGIASCKINAVTAGNHMYVVTLPNGAGFEQVFVSVNVATSGPLDYTDLWWAGAAENGWGLSVTQHGATQFIVLFVYDNAGNPVWYSMPGGTWNGANTAYTGNLYQPTSSPYSAYDAARFSANPPVGSATITYTSASTATLAYTINGVSGTKQISRQVFATDDGQPRMITNDLWWAGSRENGWGLNIAQQGKVLFPIWYTYDAAGKATFYAMPGGTWNGLTFKGELYRPTSSAWLGANYDASAFRANRVGVMNITFIDQGSATMTYTIDGVTRSGLIYRQAY